MYQHLRSMGYFVEVLGAPITCFDASQYGAFTNTEDRMWREKSLSVKRRHSCGPLMKLFL